MTRRTTALVVVLAILAILQTLKPLVMPVGTVQFYDSKILFDTGKVAMDEDCCCEGVDPCECCEEGTTPGAYIFTITGVTGSGACGDWNTALTATQSEGDPCLFAGYLGTPPYGTSVLAQILCSGDDVDLFVTFYAVTPDYEEATYRIRVESVESVDCTEDLVGVATLVQDYTGGCDWSGATVTVSVP